MKKAFYIIIAFVLIGTSVQSITASQETDSTDQPYNSNNEVTPAVGIGVTFEKQFPNAHTAQVLAEKFGKNATDEIATEDLEITQLDLSGKNIVDLSGIDIFIKLEGLYLSSNPISNLPDEIGNLSSLQTLDLSGCLELKYLPDSFGDLSNLQQITAFEIGLERLPNTLGNLLNLQILDIQFGKLTTLPDSIGNLQSLDFLKLNDNLLTSIPSSIGSLNAFMIELQGNQLTSLPDSILNLDSNTTIMIYDNLLPSDVEAKLISMGMKANLVAFSMDKLQLNSNLESISIENGNDLENINYLDLLNLSSTGVISSNHQFVLENYVDENNQAININEYINNGIVIKSGRVYAQIRATGTGLFPNNSDNAVTDDRVELNFIVTYYTLSFDLNGGEGIVPPSQDLIEGSLANIVSNPVRQGYTFKGWNDKQDGSGSTWDFTSTNMPANNTTLYAQWEKNVDPIVYHTLRFDLNGGQGTAPADQVLNIGQNAIKPANPIRDGFTFSSWNTAQDGSGQTWDFDSSAMPAIDVTLYAQWTKRNLPKTGDSSNVVLLSGLLAVAGILLIGVNKARVKRRTY